MVTISPRAKPAQFDDFLNVERHQATSAGDARDNVRIPIDRRPARELEQASVLEVHKEKSRAGIEVEIADRVELIVARIVGERRVSLSTRTKPASPPRWEIWQGYETEAWPTFTILRGKIMKEDGAYFGDVKDGKLLKRKVAEEIRNRPVP